jgi:hypothetical protein
MYRLIYLTAENTYNIFDSEDNGEMAAKEEVLSQQGLDIVCIVDYKRQFILKKSLKYTQHRDFIDDMIFDPKLVSNF